MEGGQVAVIKDWPLCTEVKVGDENVVVLTGRCAAHVVGNRSLDHAAESTSNPALLE